ncbi:hypothetical protein J6P92_03720 [bacterium]|nr:hypothetical protein [bacterium]
MKKFLVLCVILSGSLVVMADDSDINLTPKNTFSGYSNHSMKTEYPHMNNSAYQYNTTLEQQRKQWMKPTSVRSMVDTSSPMQSDRGEVSLNKFPQNYDSSDMLHVQQMHSGVQNMYMGL